MTNNETIHVYADGACSGNPGKGGWGAVLLYKNHRKDLSGAYRKTTNNRMELTAVIEALKSIKNKEIPVIVHSDSQYIVDSINKGYIHNWVNKNFNKVKNPDLWKELIQLIRQFKDIKFEWIKGHNNNPYNEACDKLAVGAMNTTPESKLKQDVYYEQTTSQSTNNTADVGLFE
ncbi:MAG: ribonuclease HI [Bacteroidetes bacterium]|jgi:ribonuclease HI|nr:MAG: ribonuclease HI [Bacteroidota bacterium]